MAGWLQVIVPAGTITFSTIRGEFAQVAPAKIHFAAEGKSRL